MKTYEEKYKKALEWMREVYPTLQGAAKEDAEYYFPELCESEDEKIRQLLLRFVKYDMSDNYSDDFTPADCVAWLEKQGKNNMGISEATKKKLEDNLNKALEKETPESLNKFLEKQGEKKSIESTKTKLNESMIKPDPNPYWTLAPEYKLMNEQKPAAWSEEDEDRINRLIAYFEDKESFTAEDDIVYANWLKSLKDRVQPQPKQEWSKEDEDILNTIINHFKVDIECTDEDDVIRWLKSLSPQSTWKPSKGQMEALWNVYRGGKEQAKLATLYNDLKKLRDK